MTARYLRMADGDRVWSNEAYRPADSGEIVLIARNVRGEFRVEREPVIAWRDDEDDAGSTPVVLMADCHSCYGDDDYSRDKDDCLGWALAEPNGQVGQVGVFTYGFRDRDTGRFTSSYCWTIKDEAKWVERMRKTHAWCEAHRWERVHDMSDSAHDH